MNGKKCLLALACILILLVSGCTGIIVKKGEKPYEIAVSPPITTKGVVPESTDVVRADKPYDIKQEIVPERAEVISDIPLGKYPKLKLGGRPVSPVDKNSVKKLEEEAKKTGQTIFVNQEPLVLDSQGGNGKWYRGIIDPGHVFLTKLTQDPKTGIREYQLERAGICWNPVKGIKIRVMPVMVKITERYLDRQVERYRDRETSATIERYRDIDYTPAIWAGLAGVALGYFIAPSGSVTKVFSSSSSKTIIHNPVKSCPTCGPGFPAPRPGL